ncbi:protein maelstrom homolog [Phymastichus coffea]|uniref:protein maelstrom homolog n=1 Tax=Phymastichus coffea TaxID=108790 RepID=UPI00273BD100|nr:protein maelstrom homolog [Phymastichus coffea]
MSKPGSTGFSAFSREWKLNKEKEGYRFKDLREAMANEQCYATWKNLPEDVKDYYRILAKCSDHHSKAGGRDRKKNSSDNRPLGRNNGRRASYAYNRPGHSSGQLSGKPAQSKIQLPPDTRRFKGTMEEYMALLMGSRKQQNCVQNLSFYIVHANYFYFRELDNNVSDYYPVEVAVAECSLENGVKRVHHVIVKEDIVKGYRNDAVIRAEESHKMPIDFNLLGKVEVETNYSEIFQSICKFIEPGSIDGELPPVFTMRSNDEHIWKPVKSILGRLALADHKHPDHLNLYSFEDLFAFISNAVMIKDKSEFDVAQAVERIEKDPNAHTNGFGCEYHQRVGEGELHCSSHFVRRWWYRLCDYCCDALRIEKIPGVHGPVDAEPQKLVFTKLNLKQGFGPKEPRDQKRYFNRYK